MARLVGTVRGRLEGEMLGISQGPTGQFAWGSSGPVVPQTLFELSNVYTGAKLSKIGIFSFWFYAPAVFNDVNAHLKFETSSGVHVFSEIGMENGVPRIRLRDDLKTIILAANSTVTPTSDTWHHMLYSWDLSVSNTWAADVHMYLDDVDVKPGSPIAFAPGNDVEWGAGNQFQTVYRMGVVDSIVNAPTLRHAAWYLTYDDYLDFSVTANRRKFITAAGLPAALGEGGELPTGNQPPFYFDDPAATVAQNRGGAGAFQAGTTVVDAPGPNP